MTTLIRGAALSDVDVLLGSLVDLAAKSGLLATHTFTTSKQMERCAWDTN